MACASIVGAFLVVASTPDQTNSQYIQLSLERCSRNIHATQVNQVYVHTVFRIRLDCIEQNVALQHVALQNSTCQPGKHEPTLGCLDGISFAVLFFFFFRHQMSHVFQTSGPQPQQHGLSTQALDLLLKERQLTSTTLCSCGFWIDSNYTVSGGLCTTLWVVA